MGQQLNQVAHDLARFLADELGHPEEAVDPILPLLEDADIEDAAVTAVGELYALMPIEGYVTPGYEGIARAAIGAYRKNASVACS